MPSTTIKDLEVEFLVHNNDNGNREVIITNVLDSNGTELQDYDYDHLVACIIDNDLQNYREW